uniref:Uncharacterized protein n=1 Tax=Aegilops tauschii subsp. strangulata TaxID=200361 RepID=A0A453DR44_AEGTS
DTWPEVTGVQAAQQRHVDRSVSTTRAAGDDQLLRGDGGSGGAHEAGLLR